MGTLVRVSLVLSVSPLEDPGETVAKLLGGQLRAVSDGSPLVSYQLDSNGVPAIIGSSGEIGVEDFGGDLGEDMVDPVDVVVREDNHLHLMCGGVDWADLGAPNTRAAVEHAQTLVRVMETHELLKGAIRDVMHHLAQIESGGKPSRSTLAMLKYLGQSLIRAKQLPEVAPAQRGRRFGASVDRDHKEGNSNHHASTYPRIA